MIDILYEDNHLIALNKKSGDIVQGDKTGDKPLSEFVKDYLRKKYNKPGNVYCGVVHRIDRPVTGVVIFAKTSKALSRMNNLFREKDLQKTYWAIINNMPEKEEATLTHYLIKNGRNNKSQAFNFPKEGALKSILSYRTIKKLDKYFLVEVQPKTGRHHQIRVQLAHIGSTIKGDLKYGAKRSNKDASINLHARQLEFVHPVKKESILIIAPPPNTPIWNACL
jgi:23S rRNA pseudouridine1911/1915/1917 synthase